MSKDGSRREKGDTSIPVALITTTGVIAAALISAVALIVTHNDGGGPTRTSTSSSPTAQAAVSSPSQSPAPSVASNPPPSTQVAGVITDPGDDSNVQSPKTITASGTVQHLERGHHLLVFLQFGTQVKYWAGDPDVTVNSIGHWSGTVCIGAHGSITLLLVDIGPKGLTNLRKNDYYYWSNGVPFILAKLAPDVRILNRISATAIPTNTTCTDKEPSYY